MNISTGCELGSQCNISLLIFLTSLHSWQGWWLHDFSCLWLVMTIEVMKSSDIARFMSFWGVYCSCQQYLGSRVIQTVLGNCSGNSGAPEIFRKTFQNFFKQFLKVFSENTFSKILWKWFFCFLKIFLKYWHVSQLRWYQLRSKTKNNQLHHVEFI